MSGNPQQPVYVYEIYIGAPVAKVWQGLTDGELTQRYVYGTRFEGALRAGARYAYVADSDFKAVEGELLEVTPHERLAMTWCAHWDEKTAGDRPSRVTYQLDSVAPATTKLRLVHDDFDGETATYIGSAEGWPLILSSLKTLLESGDTLATQ